MARIPDAFIDDLLARGRVQWLVRPVEPAHA